MKVCKNIWIFNHYAVTPDLPGGTRHFDFAKELTKRGYNITIFASSFVHGIFKDKKLKPKETWKVEKFEGVNFVWIKTFPYTKNNWKRVINMLSYSRRAYEIGKKFSRTNAEVKKPDIIIGSSLHPFAAFIAYKLSTFYSVPFIFEIRDLYPESLVDLHNISNKNPAIFLIGLFIKFLYNKANKIIVLMPYAYKDICKYEISKKKIVWIPNGVDLTNFLNKGDDKRNNEKFVVMYVGSHDKANALQILIKAAKIIQEKFNEEIIFTLIGNGKEKQNLINLSRKLSLNNINFKDTVDKKQVSKLLSNSDVLYVGLLKKNVYKYGISLNKLFDYLAAGKPIVFSSNASNNPVKEAGAGITVPAEDPEAVAEAIIKLYNMSKEERERMGENGRKYVEKHHSIPVLVDKLEKVIREVCNEPPYN